MGTRQRPHFLGASACTKAHTTSHSTDMTSSDPTIIGCNKADFDRLAILNPQPRPRLQDLYAAFEQPHVLRTWYKTHRCMGSEEVLDDDVNGKQSNLGTPLYIATVCDQPDSVALLLDLGE